MPLYPFKNEATGEQREFSYPMASAPSIGSVIEQEWANWVRLPSPFVAEDFSGMTAGWGRPSNTLPKNLHPSIAKSDKRGRPIIRSANHAREVARKTGYVWNEE